MTDEWREIPGFPDYVMSERGVVRNVLNGKLVQVRTNNVGFRLVWLRRGGSGFVGRGIDKLYRQTFPDVEKLDFFEEG